MVLVHGGPNSNVSMNYYIGVIAYVALDFDMLIVNYRGSIGFGLALVDKLLGNVSKTDVQDCHEAIHRCLQHTEPSRSVILIVMDLLHTYITSDIPDWALAQSANVPFDFETGRNRFSDTSLITYLIERSSIRLMDQIKTPVLLQLGKKDKRVPFSVGLRYYECLKANKIPTKLYVYDSNHALSETSCANNDGNRILAKYYNQSFSTVKEQKDFEKSLFNKTHKGAGDVILLDNLTVVYRNNVDLLFYVLGSTNENELMLNSVLTCLFESLMDEICDEGIILESDPMLITQRVQLRLDDIPLGEQTVSQVFNQAKEQIKWSLLK
ncbi:unnamed protein product [Rotaria magnacalcarata]|uniref:Coatomer subunit zeta n=1 Tax=Rotaria magnacalcarata TaxID=392030 RepID=A0A816T554_9BILA|nr:unnamed protein product [Rotaria magnacalcarata]